MNEDTPKVIMLSPNEVQERIACGTAYMVDVREPHENAQLRIAGSHLVPLSNFDSAHIIPDEGKELILYCRVGQRCGKAAEYLLAARYTGIIQRMTGGILEWMAADFPVETG